MPEYLAPGVFVEEVSYRSKSIEGVSTTTTGFVGPTRYGPIEEDLEVITSLVEFERTYGDGRRLEFADEADPTHNYMWHAARAFFEQGGRRLYVKRVYRRQSDTDDGRATAVLPRTATAEPLDANAIRIRARFPGALGERRVRLTLSLGPSILAEQDRETAVRGLLDRDVVWISNQPSPPAGSPPPGPGPARTGTFHVAEAFAAIGRPGWRFHELTAGGASPPQPLALERLTAIPALPEWSDEVRIVTLTVTVLPDSEDEASQVWAGLPLDPQHERLGEPDSVFAKFASSPNSRADARDLPLIIDVGQGIVTGLDVLELLLAERPVLTVPERPGATVEQNLIAERSELERSVGVLLQGGDDGVRPTAAEYEGIHLDPDTDPDVKLGLQGFEDIEDISIVAAPGSTYGYENGYRPDAQSILNHLIGHAERMKYRIAVLDSGDGQTIGQVSRLRGTLDSKHAALYYPWIHVLDPITQTEIDLPPSGYVAGIFARNDINRAVYKAPANEVVTGAIGFERFLNKAQQEVLNPLGVNCFRFFEGRGFRLWGARTISSDPEWKYVNLRRYFAYLERSIDKGTQWAVFEPNGEALWANVRRTIADFLFNEFQAGALLGDRPENAFFVKCDRSTMTQNDLDNGRLVVLIGVAALRPAEFVILRIGQWTADRKV